MKTIVGNFEIEILDEKSRLNGSLLSESEYDLIYIEDSEYSPNSLFGFKVTCNNSEHSSALIGAGGGGTGIHKSSQIIGENQIVMCCSNFLFCLSLPELDLKWKTEVEWATCFEVHPFNQDFIVHGEMTISRINPVGEIVWQKSGSDIFTTLEGKDDFVITKKYILATDWEHRKYKFDFDGNELK